MQTFIGNFIIIHCWTKEEDGKSKRETKWGVSILTPDGQRIICSFIPSIETQVLGSPSYLSLDSADQVFVADMRKGTVILLDSNLKWNRILCPAEEGETIIRWPHILCYDELKKQLIVGGYSEKELIVHTLSRK